MIVCCCKAVSDRQVRQSIDAGARDCGDVARGCGAGSACGGCRATVRQILDESAVDRLLEDPLGARA